jgi:hypothetical protein
VVTGRLRRVIRMRVLAATSATLALAAALCGCAPAEPSPQSTAAVAAECASAATGVVAAAEQLVAEYDRTVDEAQQAATSPSPSADPTQTPTHNAGDDPLADAVAAAREINERLGCEQAGFQARLEAGLAAIDTSGPIAAAVLARVSASLLGDLRQDPADWELSSGAELPEALSRAAEGTTIVLPAGTIELEQTLVLLAGVTVRGAGIDATAIRSRAPDAGIIVAASSAVRMEDLTIAHVGDRPASVVVAGPSATLALSRVRLSGAVAAGDGVGGAGLYVAAQGSEGDGRGTTLEITDARFEGNAWAGAAVAGGHRVSVVSTTFAGNGGVGVLFLDVTSGSLSDSTFTDNGIGVAASGASTPSVLRGTIAGGQVGIQVDASAAPVIDAVSISGATSAAVLFGGESTGSITGSTCEGAPYDIVVSNSAAPTLGENACTVTRGAG